MSTLSQAALGKWPSILVACGIDASFLKNKHGPCPCCGGADRYRFDNKDGKGSYFCSACGPGDGFNLLQKINGWSFHQAALEVEKVIGKCQQTILAKTDNSGNEARLKRINAGLKVITHDNPVGKYLLNRGIDILPVQDVYYHPGLGYFDKTSAGNSLCVGIFPAMVSKFRDIEGKTCAFHVTYLTSDGHKIPNHTPKKFLPKISEMTGGAIRLGGVAGDLLGIAEGIETALAAMQESGHTVWAASNANFLQNIQIPESVKRVAIYSDEDSSFTGQKSAYTLANRLKVRESLDVEVIRILGKGGPLYSDRGCDTDYCDYINQ